MAASAVEQIWERDVNKQSKRNVNLTTAVLVASAAIASAARAGDECPHPADQNGDRVVGGADLGMLVSAWGPVVGYSVADITEDGVVDGADLEALLVAWGPVPFEIAPEPYSYQQMLGLDIAGSFEVLDVDLDGDVDIVSAEATLDGAYILCHLNDGTGHFVTQQQYAANGISNVNRSVSFDANGDALPDLAFGATVSVRLSINLGNGEFAPMVFPGNLPGSLLASIDHNGDTKRDLLLGFNTSVYVAHWTGTAFEVSAPITTAFNVVYGAVGDVDGDGDEDAVVSGGETGVFGWQVLENVAGTLIPKPHVTMASRPYGLVLVDQDGDGRLDVMVSRSGTGGLQVYRGAGLGTFGAAIPMATGLVVDMAAGDLNGDNRPDVFGRASASTTRDVAAYLNQTGSFLKAGSSVSLGYSTSHRSPRVADIDGDCRAEAFIAMPGGVCMIRERANILMGPATVPGSGTTVVAVADLDDDGFDDIVRAGSGFGYVTWGNGTALQGGGVQTVGLPSGSDFSGGCLVDVNADGRLDVVGYSSSKLKSWVNLGNRQFGAPSTNALSFMPLEAIPARVDADGYMDLAVMTQPIQLYRGQPDGTLQLASSLFIQSAVAAEVIDLDEDGDDDVLVAVSKGRIRVMMNHGGILAFDPSKDFGDWYEMLGLNVVDYDKDGDLDVVEWHRQPNPDYGIGATVWRNDGYTPGFHVVFNGDFLGTVPTLVTDLEADGVPELVGPMTVFSIGLDGAIRLSRNLPSPGSAGVAAGSFGADAHLDIVVGGSSLAPQIHDSKLPVEGTP